VPRARTVGERGAELARFTLSRAVAAADPEPLCLQHRLDATPLTSANWPLCNGPARPRSASRPARCWPARRASRHLTCLLRLAFLTCSIPLGHVVFQVLVTAAERAAHQGSRRSPGSQGAARAGASAHGHVVVLDQASLPQASHRGCCNDPACFRGTVTTVRPNKALHLPRPGLTPTHGPVRGPSTLCHTVDVEGPRSSPTDPRRWALQLNARSVRPTTEAVPTRSSGCSPKPTANVASG